jgi:octaprenyl-diphosphate synthase
VLAGARPSRRGCADYGQALGTAFQVIDDVLDYAGDVEEMGKNLGDDLREGKTTLPLIAAMQRGTAGAARADPPCHRTGDVDNWADHPSCAKPARWTSREDAAAAEAQRAMSALPNLLPRMSTQALVQLAASLLERRN